MAKTFETLLRESGKVRLDIDEVTRLFRAAHPQAADEWDVRQRMLDTLRSMDGQVVELPDTSAWDRRRAPALPRTVRVVGASSSKAPTKRLRSWAPELQDLQDWIGRLNNPVTLAALEAINDWIIRRRGHDLPMVPTPERSLDIFGDEKRLDHMRGGETSLFGGRLRLDRLRTYATPLPLIYQQGKGPGPILIVENLASYDSFRHWNADPRSGHPFGAIAWGEGNKILALTPGLLECAATLRCEEVFYIGDLDPEGLTFLVDLCDWSSSTPISVRPHLAAYRYLLDYGRRASFERSREVKVPVLTDRLPEPMRGEIADLVGSGYRIAQEALGTEALYRAGADIFPSLNNR